MGRIGTDMLGDISIDASKIICDSDMAASDWGDNPSGYTVSDALTENSAIVSKSKNQIKQLFEVMIASQVKSAIRSTSTFPELLRDIFSNDIETESSLNFIFDKFVSYDESVLNNMPDYFIPADNYAMITERLVDIAALGVCSVCTEDQLKIPFYFADSYFLSDLGLRRIAKLVDDRELVILQRLFDLPYDSDSPIDYNVVKEIEATVKGATELYS